MTKVEKTINKDGYRICNVDPCERKHKAKGYCKYHYDIISRGKSIEDYPPTTRITSIDRPEYTSWVHLKARCLNPKNDRYHRYGDRGIVICERWLNSFDNFLEDMGPRPSQNHSIDRIDNDGNYEPSNCKWSTHMEQQWNKGLRPNNTSGYAGVKLNKNSTRWIACIWVHKKYVHLGTFDKKEDAINARKLAEIKYWK